MATQFQAIAASELRDTQGEILDVKGADISELEAGRGIVNDNHSNKLPDVIGRITYAKKIFKIEDCEDEDQKRLWNKVKAPYIFTRGVLFDDQDHRSAKAAAAIIKHQHAFDSPLKLKCSVEGGILERGKSDDRILKRTKIKGLALTLTPANNATLVEGLNLAKCSISVEEEALIKSFIPLAKENVPTFIEIANTLSESKIRNNINKIYSLIKTLSAGVGVGSPTDRTGGQVLQTETIDDHSKRIECPSCGHSQWYMSHQVRCRDCGKSFPFDTLAKFFLKK